MQSPFFSVIIPTYNRKEFLKKAINSVLEQTEKDWELLIVDDGSSDGSQPLKEERSQRRKSQRRKSQRRKSQRSKKPKKLSQRLKSQRRKSQSKKKPKKKKPKKAGQNYLQRKYSLVHKKTLWSE